ncbi:MAG: VOC family protein [Mycobacteriales bacterium]|nr:VOC family protein [Frankia sp.]
MSSRWHTTVVDCVDPQTLAKWWAQLFDVPVVDESANGEEEFVVAPIGEGVEPYLLFIRVPEPKTVKNRLHIDLNPDDRDAEVERLVAMGARRVDVGQSDDVTWVVLADPEGNEFCVLRAR